MEDQTELVPALTFRLLEVAGSPERSALLYRLLHGEATAKELRTPAETAEEGNPYLQQPLDQSTGSRCLTRFSDIGLAHQISKKHRLTCPSETRDFLEAANRLALAIAQSSGQSDDRIDKNLRRDKVGLAKAVKDS
jgi:hypothetical protein